MVEKKVTQKEKRNQLKANVRKLELKNYSKLILFKIDNTEWYKMGDHSLLIYKYVIAPKINVQPNVQPDSDYTDTVFEDGLISFHGLEGLMKKLKAAGAYRELKTSETSAVFELTFGVTDEQIKEYRKKLKEETERAIAVLRPKVFVEPDIYTRLRFIQKRVFEMVRKSSIYERSYNGDLMNRYAHDATQTYLLMNNGTITEDAGWTKILKIVELLLIEINFAVELKIWDQNQSVRISEDILTLKRRATQSLNRYKKENVHTPPREK